MPREREENKEIKKRVGEQKEVVFELSDTRRGKKKATEVMEKTKRKTEKKISTGKKERKREVRNVWVGLGFPT